MNEDILLFTLNDSRCWAITRGAVLNGLFICKLCERHKIAMPSKVPPARRAQRGSWSWKTRYDQIKDMIKDMIKAFLAKKGFSYFFKWSPKSEQSSILRRKHFRRGEFRENPTSYSFWEEVNKPLPNQQLPIQQYLLLASTTCNLQSKDVHNNISQLVTKVDDEVNQYCTQLSITQGHLLGVRSRISLIWCIGSLVCFMLLFPWLDTFAI